MTYFREAFKTKLLSHNHQVIELLKKSIGYKMHFNCINNSYPNSGDQVKRFPVQESLVDWGKIFLEYSPVEYTAPSIMKKPSYADPDISDISFQPKWNELDGIVNRKSFSSNYCIVDGRPRNYKGRTGISGRGCLGRWGPNHAADPVVTRWKIDDYGNVVISDKTNKKVLQMVCIQRRDNSTWAIPGGMVDPGEKVTSTLVREFMEEALNSLDMTDSDKISVKESLNSLFSKGTEIYSGYVDDPRNTDNAWMETVAYHFHDEEYPSGLLYKLKLQSGDDAKAVKWMDIDKNLSLYASHADIIYKAVQRLLAHW